MYVLCGCELKKRLVMDSCNIKVAIKARPLNPKEQSDGRIYWKVECDSVIHIDPITEKKTGEQFFFGKYFLWYAYEVWKF